MTSTIFTDGVTPVVATWLNDVNSVTYNGATALKSATTTVNISSATAPTVGQVLTGTSGTSATWQSPGTFTTPVDTTATTLTIAPATADGHAVRLSQISSATVPMFSAYQSVAQTGLSNGVWTKVNFQTKEFDTTSAFDNTTNMRFSPTTAGYYQISAGITASSATTAGIAAIYKNGVVVKAGNYATTTSVLFNTWIISALIYLDGTGSGANGFVEIWTIITGTSPAIAAGVNNTYFQAALIARA